MCNHLGEVIGIMTSDPDNPTSVAQAKSSFAVKGDVLLKLAGTIPDLKLATGVGVSKLSNEERVMLSTFSIKVTKPRH